MKKNITILPGDGIGPEITQQAIKVMEAVCHHFDHDFKLTSKDFGAISIDNHGTPLTEETLNSCLNSDAILLGAIGDPKYDNNPEIKVRPEQGLLALRKELGLHTNVRPITTYDELKIASPLKTDLLKDVDMVIYRELTGGIYFGDKVLSEDGTQASDSCSYNTEEITRIAKAAFKAASNRRKKLTLVDKANVLETSRLWRKTIQELSSQYPDVEVDYMFVDNAAMQIVINPAQFDVILTENMFGDILSDLSSVLTGSLGMLPSSSVGDKTALFEPIHGSYPQAAGMDIANPMATILSVAMMFEYFDLFEEANAIRNAVNWALKEEIVTKDIHPANYESCSTVGDLIAIYIEQNGEVNLNRQSILDSRNCII